MIDFETMKTAVDAAVGRYARTLRRIDPRDLEQEAWLAALEAREKFDAGKGADPWSWVYRSACWRLREYGTTSAAVTGPKHRAEARFCWGLVLPVPLKDAGALVDDKPSPAEALEDAELRKIAVAAVRKALGKVDPRVRPILLGEDKARRVAKKLCMPVAEVYKLTGEGRKVVRSDKALAAAHRRIA